MKAAILMAVLLLACSGPTGRPRQVLTVRVESYHFFAKTVRVQCDSGLQLGALRGVVMGRESQADVRLSGCQTVRLQVDAIGGEVWMSEYVPVMDGDTLTLRIGPSLSLSSLWKGDA